MDYSSRSSKRPLGLSCGLSIQGFLPRRGRKMARGCRNLLLPWTPCLSTQVGLATATAGISKSPRHQTFHSMVLCGDTSRIPAQSSRLRFQQQLRLSGSLRIGTSPQRRSRLVATVASAMSSGVLIPQVRLCVWIWIQLMPAATLLTLYRPPPPPRPCFDRRSNLLCTGSSARMEILQGCSAREDAGTGRRLCFNGRCLCFLFCPSCMRSKQGDSLTCTITLSRGCVEPPSGSMSANDNICQYGRWLTHQLAFLTPFPQHIARFWLRLSGVHGVSGHFASLVGFCYARAWLSCNVNPRFLCNWVAGCPWPGLQLVIPIRPWIFVW